MIFAIKVRCTCKAQKATKYLADLEKQGLFPHFIWAEHCLKGSLGAPAYIHAKVLVLLLLIPPMKCKFITKYKNIW